MIGYTPGMNRRTQAFWLLAWLVSGLLQASDAAATRPAGGSPIPGERLSLRSLAGDAIPFAESLGPSGRAVCFAFLHPACPLAQEYGPVLDALAKEFAREGVRFVGVICELDHVGEVEAYRREFGITFPICLDTDFTLAEALGATVTPEVVVVDRDRVIRYAGRIDDRYKVRGVMTPGDPDPELRSAILDLLAGREIREPRTEAAGCPLDRPERPTPASVSREARVSSTATCSPSCMPSASGATARIRPARSTCSPTTTPSNGSNWGSRRSTPDGCRLHRSRVTSTFG
jgi:thiol-disulfide isomerase/thioredoxin